MLDRAEKRGASRPRSLSHDEDVDDLVGRRLDDYDAPVGDHEIVVTAVGRPDLDNARRQRLAQK